MFCRLSASMAAARPDIRRYEPSQEDAMADWPHEYVVDSLVVL